MGGGGCHVIRDVSGDGSQPDIGVLDDPLDDGLGQNVILYLTEI